MSTPLQITPASVRTFRYVSRSFDATTGTAVFTYALDHLELYERYEFPMPAPGEDGRTGLAARVAGFLRLLDQLFITAGLSYYKMAAPQHIRIECGSWDDRDIAAHSEILAGGLGEFCFHNNLPARLAPTVERFAASHEALTDLGLDAGPLVPVGGGKDSSVTIEAFRAFGLAPVQITVNRYPVIQHVIEASGLPDLAVRRILDPRIGELNRNGALNGHVPVTAIVSLAVAATAVLHGHRAVVMSNERSASEGNVSYQGVEINHQWSKSAEAEDLLAGIIRRATPELQYFSLLRPLSELSIVQRFAATCERYFDTFSSCNAAFRLDADRRVERWCGQCPKCQFVYLALATVMDRSALLRIFGTDVFRSSSRTGFEALLGLGSWKPFECVGESGECRVALRLVAAQPEWHDHDVVARLSAAVHAHQLWPDDADVAAVFAQHDAPGIPPEFRELIRAGS